VGKLWPNKVADEFTSIQPDYWTPWDEEAVEIKSGLDYLVKNMRSNGGWMGDSDKMYAHPIAVIALSEAFQIGKFVTIQDNGAVYLTLPQSEFCEIRVRQAFTLFRQNLRR
jgi:hypothetical protein